jgi:hypothetical protein
MLSENLQALLAKRFRHYVSGTELGFEQTDQPGILSVGGGTYPAILLGNDVWWFPAREARPMTDEGRSMKTKAPTGTRFVMVDDSTLDEIVVVEGEGDAFAMRFVGYTGIAIAGGVNNLLDSDPAAVKNRKEIFAGKNVRLLFDADEAGVKGAIKGARQLLADGAERVAIVSLTKAPDVEDWLEEFEDPGDALRALTHLIGGSSWEDANTLEKIDAAADAEIPVVRTTSTRVFVPGDATPRLITMTYDRKSGRVDLARFGPLTEPKLASPGYGDVSADPDVERGWSIAGEHEIAGTLYVPDRSDAVREYLRFGTLVLPPPPVENASVLSSVELWRELREFVRRWVVLDEYALDVLVAYALLTWRLEDAGFRYVPYLRFFGPPGSGKGRALDVMRQITWRSFSTQPTNLNLHRIIDFFGDISLIVDEFHIDKTRGESQQQLIDTLCLGYDRAQLVARVVGSAKGKGEEIKNFRLFGPKIFSGYGADEHEALARRSVTVEMVSDADVPSSMSPLGLPDEFYDEGERLRAHLLAWRGRNLTKGLPDARSHPHSEALVERSGFEVGQVFFPLVAMIPESMSAERERVFEYAAGRRTSVRETRAVTDDAFLVEAFVNAATGPNGFDRGGVYLATPQLVFDTLGDRNYTTALVGRRLKALGFRSSRPRASPTGSRCRYYEVDPTNAADAMILKRAGVRFPKHPEAADFDGAVMAAL